MIFGDEIFKTCRSLFNQIYTLHGEVRGHVLFLCMFCLSRKTNLRTKLYSTKSNGMLLNLYFAPEIIMFDYELVAINAVNAVIPETEPKGCLFHWSQAIWKRAVIFHNVKVKVPNPNGHREVMNNNYMTLLSLV